MASSFKIPKKKQASASDSPPLQMQSPLSRLQAPNHTFKSYGDQSRGGGANRMHSGSTQRASKLPFRDVVKKMLGINGSENGTSAANERQAGSWKDQSQPRQRAEASPAPFSNGWRPKRGSDRLLTSQPPPQKKTGPKESISVTSRDCLAELRGEMHPGNLSSSVWRSRDADQEKGETGNSPPASWSDDDDNFLPGPSVSTVTPPPPPRRCHGDELEAVREKEREKWRRFKMKKPSTPEPIILSSEEEDESDGGNKMVELQAGDRPPPSFLQLEFSRLHAGLTHADGNGDVTITEHGITIPLTGSEDGDVTVVASQLRGYGVWDGGVVRGGALLSGWIGPAPSLLFLWVSDSQASLLQRELTAINNNNNGLESACCLLLLVLKQQLTELQSALLHSVLDMDQYKASLSTPASPLDWAEGLLLMHSCSAPHDQHWLSLLGRSQDESSEVRISQRLRQQQLPSRLIQYPLAPGKGRISVSTEDLSCLRDGQFLNDVIIDFYLKFLLIEGGSGPVSERSHVFSSFFFKQLSRRTAAGDSDVTVPDRHTRHHRVKTWTRHVDIFTKDFLFVPVNQEAHWYLVVVCFPGLEEVQIEAFSNPTAGKPSASLRSRLDCTQRGFDRDTVVKRPCILVMDSLKLSYHENVCRLIRDYLQVEWSVRRASARIFSSENMRSSKCRVPQQDNSSDCGLYLLQYVESFLQNPVVHFELPLQLDHWFPRQRVRRKRDEIRTLILKMHQSQKIKVATHTPTHTQE